MIRKLIIFLLVLFLSGITLAAQSVEVFSKSVLTNDTPGDFYFPKFSNDGKNVVFTSDGYKGLWLYDEYGVKKITDKEGAGYNPVFTSSGSVIFRSSRFENMKRISSLFEHNLATGRTNRIVNESRSLTAPVLNSNREVEFVLDGELNYYNSGILSKRIGSQLSRSVMIDDSKLLLIENGVKKYLQPLGDGNYIWSSLSPDGSQLLFSVAGKGTYISDLDGKILHSIGKANYPVWAKEGKWILYMDDKDDGRQFTASDIYLISLETYEKFNLTNTGDEIEMYPDYSMTNDEVVYHTLHGQIIKLKLKFK
ncbi:MAG: PD40 domain-containing protein [Melioribacteraceae bacterium]|nr:PD40 domain-containing protein [Melioribacteraceae bacterium]